MIDLKFWMGAHSKWVVEGASPVNNHRLNLVAPDFRLLDMVIEWEVTILVMGFGLCM